MSGSIHYMAMPKLFHILLEGICVTFEIRVGSVPLYKGNPTKRTLDAPRSASLQPAEADFVIVDLEGRATVLAGYAIAISDYVIIPVRGSKQAFRHMGPRPKSA